MKSYEKEYRHCLENSNKMELVDKIIYDEKEIERLNNIINKTIKFVEQTSEYYHDGVNEEIIDILKGEEIRK